MLIKFIKLCLIFIIIGGGIILYNQKKLSFSLPEFKNVKGINTSKAAEIPNQLKSEAEKKVKDTKISDLINIYNQAQKLARDFRAFQEYLKKEAANLVKKK